jgi:hypothetical protein
MRYQKKHQKEINSDKTTKSNGSNLETSHELVSKGCIVSPPLGHTISD